uniref:galactosyltransferase-related protein n=1 Tax=uncultured Dysgonomonas sp. TaxID=206096 RepID=UPI00262A6541|nr:galactosyltransferase-related protein [uncultured Dysgonomonas sp.]
MRIDLRDVTFCVLIRLDSIQRLENILIITRQLCRYFDTNIIVREADGYNNGILKKLLNKHILYEFVEDKDPVLYKTKHFNQMTHFLSTPYLGIWDADIVVDKNAIMDVVTKLRNKEADVALPYNGICMDVPEIMRSLFVKNNDPRLLHRHRNKMGYLYPHFLVGGAIIVNREKYIQAGQENEKHYGWGNDDFDRYYRYIGLGYIVFHSKAILYHLYHPRETNSHFHSLFQMHISEIERRKMKDSTEEEIKNYINGLGVQ